MINIDVSSNHILNKAEFFNANPKDKLPEVVIRKDNSQTNTKQVQTNYCQLQSKNIEKKT